MVMKKSSCCSGSSGCGSGPMKSTTRKPAKKTKAKAKK